MDYQKLADLLYPTVPSVEDILKKYPPRALTNGAEVTRFAPSPTGNFHMGGLFSALIDFSLAKSSGGIFILRNEDTDKKREVSGALEAIFDMLVKFNMKPDEYQKTGERPVGQYGPYIQSQRLEIYHAFAKKLVAEGKAFPCFCKKTNGKEEILKARKERFSEDDSNIEYDPCRNMPIEEAVRRIKAGEKFAIRLKTPNDGNTKIVFEDLGKGRVELPANAKDVILVKNDGFPPYAFAHAIDDTLMGTTTAVRGGEWFTSTPAHLDIFDALGFKHIKYYHTPNICKIDEENGGKRKLSKRKDKESGLSFFFEQGYPTDALIEYLLNLISSSFEPWRAKNPDAPYQDFKFGLDSITAVSPLFDMAKLDDVSKNVFARMDAQEVYDGWLTWAKEYNKPLAERLEKEKEYFLKVCGIDRGGLKPRKDIYCYSMIQDYFSYMLSRPKQSDEIDNIENYREFLNAYGKNFKLPADKDAWFADVKRVAESLGYAVDNKLYKQNPDKFKGNTAKACEYIRLALTGRKNSPDIYELMTILGEKETKSRLKV